MKGEEIIKNEEILRILKKTHPHAGIALNYSNNWELLVSVILSAQCTDKRVNIVTEKLFKKYKEIGDYANADISEFELDIRSTGFYRNKAKNILSAAKLLLAEFKGEIPKTMEEMLTIPGVARKTANVVLGNAYGVIEGIAVDTHVIRLSQRLGLSKNKTPEKIEKDLMNLYDKKEWFRLTYLLIQHGRAICDAKRPMCDRCPLNKICPSAFQFKQFEGAGK
ncbi:endonuclease III [Candidatus Dojkabacteria bacterium]|nr:endonuclease III [Candidatus Dojkabacteria bacterium]